MGVFNESLSLLKTLYVCNSTGIIQYHFLLKKLIFSDPAHQDADQQLTRNSGHIRIQISHVYTYRIPIVVNVVEVTFNSVHGQVSSNNILMMSIASICSI